MLTVIKSPDAIAFSRNEQLMRVRVTDGTYPYRAYGAKAFLEVAALSNGLAAGNSIEVRYTDPDTGAVVTITFIAGIGVSDESLPTLSGVATSGYRQEVFDKIARHPLLAPFFSFQSTTFSGANLLEMEGRNRAFDYAPSFTVTGASGWSSTGPLAPTNTNVPENFACLFDVFFERQYNDGGWERVARLQVVPDDGGYATINLESILTQEWNYARYRAGGTNQPIVADVAASGGWITPNLRRYYVRAGEQQGSPIEVLGWEQSDVVLTLDGGVTHRAAAGGDYLTTLTTAQSLASWRPRKRVVSPLQPAFLSWFNSAYAGSVLMKLTEQAYDGTWGTATTVASVAANLYDTVTMAAGALQLGIDHSVTGRYKLELFLADETSQTLVDTVYYTIDCQRYKSLRFLVWRNSWGAPEDLRCTGHSTQQTEVQRSKAVRPLVHEYGVHYQERIQYHAEEERTVTYRTGYLSLDEQIALQDMFKINDVWELQPDGTLCALDLLGSQMRVYDTRDLLHAFEFEAAPRLSVHNHAPGFGADAYTQANNPSAGRGGPWVDNTGNWQDGAGDNWMYGG